MKIQCWLAKQHMALLQDLTSTERQARGLISDPRTAAKTRLLSFNRTQSRVLIGLLTGNNTLRRHLYIVRLIDSALCWRCGTQEETSADVLCECEALATHRHTYLSSFFLGPENVRNLSLGTIWNFIKGTGLPCLGFQRKGHKGPVKGLRAWGPKGLNPLSVLFFYSTRR